MTHGHEVLAMMQGHRNTERSLLELIIIHFGSDERFCTCSAENLTAHVLIDFLKELNRWGRDSWWTLTRCEKLNKALTACKMKE